MSEIQNIKTLQEIFGITVTEAENSYNYYNKDLDAAIQGLSSDSGVRYGPENRNEGDGSSAASSDVASGSNNNPIDLTTTVSGEDDLQKALALSLLDMNRGSGIGGSGTGGSGVGGSSSNEPISQEEQDLSRALEASLADNQTNMTRLGMSYTLYEPLNPHERKREKNEPVGLKNIGNTCWFASVIQSLFYIPQFRDCILGFVTPDSAEQLPCVKFVEELQKLFALLLKSKERYINPKPALDVLYSVFNNASGSQQDVSEFTHKLLEWMEDAFSQSQTKDRPNPIVGIFTGQCVTEGLLNDQPFVNESQFGAFPVQIEGHAHLHDSLEAATVNTEIQQETWFTHLPPILVIELARFKYNQTSGQAEKIHDQLAFDLVLHMDRYLQKNCHESRKKREDVFKLRQEEHQFTTALKSYTNYNGRPISLIDVLSLALNFVNSTPNVETDSESYRHIPIPRSGSCSDITITGTCLRQWRTEIESEISEIQEKLDATKTSLNSVYSDELMQTTPYRLHAVLVHQGEASGGHYWAYVRKKYEDINGGNTTKETAILKEKEEKCNGEQQVVGNDGEMEQEEECVVIDLGGKEEEEVIDEENMEVDATKQDTEQTDNHSLANMVDLNKDISLDDAVDTVPSSKVTTATTGDREVVTNGGLTNNVVTNGDWLKCNDISVTEVNWDEVRRESFGRSDYNSNSNTSAYCLVYISDETAQELKEQRETIVDLNDTLMKYVSISNQSYEKALEDYDIKKSQKQELEKENGFIKPAKLVRFESPNAEVTNFARKILDTSPSEAKRARNDGPYRPEKNNSNSDLLPQKEVDPLLVTQLQAKISQKCHSLTCEVPDSIRESRILSEFRYATDCGFSEKVRQAILLYTISIEAQVEGELGLSLLAKKEYCILLQETSKDLECVRRMYKSLCGVCHHCLQAIECIRKDDWCLALPHVVKSYSMNFEIRKMSNNHCAMRNDLLTAFRSKVVLMVSQKGTLCFSSGNAKMGLSIGDQYIVPAIKELCTQTSDGSEQVVEKVREDWCKLLGPEDPLSEGDADNLADLLVRIVEEDYSKASNMELPKTPDNFNTQQLVSAFSNAFKYFLTEIIPDIA